MLAPRLFQIVRRRAQKDRIVAEETEPAVAFAAQQAANNAGDVTMVDVEPHAGSLADGAVVALPRHDGAKLREREPVAAGALAVAEVGVGGPSVPHARVDEVLAAGAAGAATLARQRLIERILLPRPVGRTARALIGRPVRHVCRSRSWAPSARHAAAVRGRRATVTIVKMTMGRSGRGCAVAPQRRPHTQKPLLSGSGAQHPLLATARIIGA